MGSTTPTWLGYHFHGPPYVVAANVFGGKQVYQLDTEGGHPVAADIIKESADGVDLWPAAHYGRVMVNLKGLPVTGSVGIMTESGLLPGSTTNTAQYTLGAVDGKLSFSYMQRVRPYKNDVSTPLKRIGGNWENATEAPTTLCTVAATTTTIAVNKWVCVEWMIDRTKPELHVARRRRANPARRQRRGRHVLGWNGADLDGSRALHRARPRLGDQRQRRRGPGRAVRYVRHRHAEARLPDAAATCPARRPPWSLAKGRVDDIGQARSLVFARS